MALETTPKYSIQAMRWKVTHDSQGTYHYLNMKEVLNYPGRPEAATSLGSSLWNLSI